MEFSAENRDLLLDRVVLANQSVGVIRYIGPLQDLEDNTGTSTTMNYSNFWLKE
jgi:hypothetical protein